MSNNFERLSLTPVHTPGVPTDPASPSLPAPQSRTAAALAPPSQLASRWAVGSASEQSAQAPRASLPAAQQPLPQLQGYGSGKIAGYSADLKGYELLKASIHEKPTGKTAELLDRGQEAVDETRAILRYGRGNIGSDQLATGNDSFARLSAAYDMRESEEKAYIAAQLFFSDCAEITIRAEIASMTQAGNCADFSAKVFTHFAQGNLGEGESIERKINTETDHAWTELQARIDNRKQKQRIVADPWTSGPSVCAEDSRCSAQEKIERVVIKGEICSPEQANLMAYFVDGNNKSMRENYDPDAYIDYNRAELLPGTWLTNASPNPIPVLSKSFIDKTQPLHADHLTTQVQAVGVLRKSDNATARISVQEAVAAIPQVVNAAEKLRDEVILHEQTNPPW